MIEWEREERLARKRHAVSLVLRFGNHPTDVARMFGVSERTIRRWCREGES